MVDTLPKLLPPLGITVAASSISLALALALGLISAIARELSPHWHPVRLLVDSFVELVRGTPAIVQIFAAFFLLPKVGIDLPPFWVGVVALTVNSVGYQIEIFRAAIASVDRGQRDAALAVGMSEGMALWHVIVPQASQRAIPPLTNELSNLVKASSVLSVIALFELHKASSAISSSSYKYIEVLILESILYFSLIQTLSWGAAYLERRVSYRDRTVPTLRWREAMLRA